MDPKNTQNNNQQNTPSANPPDPVGGTPASPPPQPDNKTAMGQPGPSTQQPSSVNQTKDSPTQGVQNTPPEPPSEYFQPASTQPPPAPPATSPPNPSSNTDNPPITPEPAEQPAPEPTTSPEEVKKKSKLPLILIVLIIVIITIGALTYILLNYAGTVEEELIVQESVTEEVMVPEPANVLETDADIEALSEQSNSDEIEAIETDILGTDFTNLDAEIDSITKEL